MIKATDPSTALSIAAIRMLEKRGLEQGLPLMQRAGTSAAVFLHDQIKPASHVVVLVGPGNNGGDALVAAAELHKFGHRLTVVMPQAAPDASADAKHALMHWLVIGGTVMPDLPADKPDVVIDGLFGIGLSRTLDRPWTDAIQTVNAWQVPVLALDIPSGLHADTGQALCDPIHATWTLSFIAPSLATNSDTARKFFGECFLEDLDLEHD
ncbi:MAG: NAD(P)H-hydrate epimerase [Burkholderiaceae bacterium]|nr:NAD(P)H-hydrate epimerase [Burkholderiaceae bacterium]MCD8518152.1 NAD(P)H-hydrate epimerase [Burkholderiaceae bacterium]MCD8537738.1 NAD(P)H-hydrate epimerase [Burkholderiaceae bacterium]MCD8564317.1 NAD(P)H-hydrate epimerase [Burkholderiaceae bacterium]